MFFYGQIKGKFVAKFLRVIFAYVFKSRFYRGVHRLYGYEFSRAEQGYFFAPVVAAGYFVVDSF